MPFGGLIRRWAKRVILPATDYHCHLLPGLDDGPKSMEEAVKMAECLFSAGIKEVFCTPHLIKGLYEAENRLVEETLKILQKELSKKDIGLNLKSGREYCLDEFLPHLIKDPMPLEGTRMILIEIPPRTPLKFVEEMVYLICRNNLKPLIAHPERNQLFWGKDLSSLNYLIESDCWLQLNISSLRGHSGPESKAVAERLEKGPFKVLYGTDAHRLEDVLRLNPSS